MPERTEKMEYYARMAKDASEQITSGWEPWTGFLTMAARLYKYPFADQLMIYKQRPDATACAEYGLWNNTMGRYIKRGSKGIALLDSNGDTPRLRYVFDVSDTGVRQNSRPLPQWEMRDEFHIPVMAALECAFGVAGTDGLLMQLTEIAEVLAGDYWERNAPELIGILADCYLSQYDSAAVGDTFRMTAANSIRYALYTRCTDTPNAFFSYTDFQGIFDFNTQAAANTLGTAVSNISGQVFREIEAAIRTYERERSHYHDRTDLHTAGRLSDPQPPNEPEPVGTPGPVREHAESVSSGAPGADLQPPMPDRAAVPASSGSSAHRNPADGAADDRTAQEESAPEQGDGSAGVGPAYEQPESSGGGDHSGRADLHLNFDGSEQLSLLNLMDVPPSEAEQIRRIDEAERAMPSAFSVPQAVIDQFLRFGSNTADSRMNIVSEFSKGKPISVLVPFLRTQYHGGYGIEADGVQYSAWYADDGIMISAGKAARYANPHVLIPWETAAQRIEELLLEGSFATNLEVVEAPTHEREQLASSLWNVQRDRSDLARENGYLSELAALGDGIYPEAVQKIAAALVDPVRRDALIAEYQVFNAALAQEPQLLAFRNRDVAWLAAALPELPMPRKDYPATPPELPAVSSFITTDEINAAIASHGRGMAGGRHRIYAYFETHALRADRAAFLKQEYGIGGHAPALSGAQHSSEDHDSKGICFKKAGCENVLLSWPSLAKRIGELMENRRYLTEDELARLDDWEYDVEQDLTEDSEEANAIVEAESTAETSWEPQPGQAVYLDDTRYVIESVGLFDVHLTDNTQTYPITRVESKERLPSLARLDERNNPLFEAPALESVPISVEPDVTVEQAEIPENTALPAENFHITDDHLGEGGPKTKFRRNLDAIRLLKELEQDNRQASAEEQEILSQYVGWGGLADAFDESKTDWASEFQELSSVLTPEEYADARASTLNAHYTSPTVIRAIYDAVEQLGFHTGNILEPSMGVGNFFGMLPDSMAGSSLYGVELDSISGRIAKQLYPSADITVAGFETTDRRDFFDLAVGNVPFGNYKVNDRPYNKLGFSIHNYFFAKAIDQVRPGGIIAFVTSRYTMDSANTEARKYIAQRAELLGAIRLPNNAFRANAGTDVVSDILFLQKREQPIDLEPDWVHLGMTEDGLPLSSYYLSHPEMVLGTLTSESTQYGKDSLTVLPMDELTGGRGIIFATGTPVSNSMTELYTMQRYLQYSTLQRMGLGHFDCWASTFGETTTAIELAPEGTGYRARTRFAKFFNLPELMNMFKEIADIKTADQLDLPRPEAKYETIVVEPSELQQEMVQSLSQRAAAVHAGIVDSSVDNMLCITNDGRKIGLDQRLMNPMLPDDPNSKLNACVRKVLDIYEARQADKLTQLIFCDLSTPKNDGNFNVYEDIKGKLLASGVLESEIAFIHDADTDAKKTALFSKVRSGDVRILLGSTQKMGAGTNVQDRLIAVHHLDVGWKPADLTQRNGRIIRQGNRNPAVQIYNYVTNGTFDAYLFQTLENKQKFISQIMTSKSPIRACEDVDEQALSFAEIKALCAGNPAIKEKMDLDIEVARLKVLRADHLSQQYRLEDRLLKYFPAEIEKYQNLVSSLTVDMQTAQNHPTPAEGFVGIELQGKSFAEKELAGEALLAACKGYTGAENVQIGSYRGFRVELDYDHFQNAFLAVLHGQLRHAVTLGADARGNLTRLDNALSKIPSRIEAANAQLENLHNQQAAAKEELGKPFPQEQELQQKSARLAELDAELSMDSPEEPETPAPEERPSVLKELRERMAQLADSRSGDDLEVAL